MKRFVFAAFAWLVVSTVMAGAAGSAARVTVERGFGGSVYNVKSAGPKASHSSATCPLTFANTDTSTEALFATDPKAVPCASGALAGAKEGLQILIGVGQTSDFVPGASAIATEPPAKGDYLRAEVCREPCSSPWSLTLIVARSSDVFAVRNGHEIKGITSAYQAKSTPCADPDKAVPQNRWCTIVTIPWDLVELPFDATPSTVRVRTALVSNRTTHQLAEATITVLQKPAEHVSAGDSGTASVTDHRSAYFTQYDQYAAQVQTPAPTLTVREVPGPTAGVQFKLAKPFTPAGAPSRFPPLNGDVNAPLSQNLLMAGTFSQSNTFVQGLQKAIKSGIKNFPTKAGPQFPCESCVTFQTQNSDVFTFPKTSAVAHLFPDSLGLDDAPLKVDTLPDLFAGGAIYGSSDDGTTRAGVLHANPTKGFSGGSSSDTAVSLMRTRGGATLAAQATMAVHALAPTSLARAPGKLPATSLPQVNTYSAFVADSNPKSDGIRRVSSNVSPVFRFSYDASDRASNAMGGLQAIRTTYDGDGNAFRAELFGGYRSIGSTYHTLDGVQPAYPAVSGPLAAADLAWQGAQGAVPKIELSGYFATYASPLDHFSVQGAKGQVGLGKTVSAYYELSQGRISASLAAVSQLGTQLGDAPYQAAREALVPGILGQTYGTRDQTVGLQLKTNDATALKSALNMGYNFEHVAPSCTVVGAVVECLRSQGKTGSLTAAASFAVGDFALAGSYKPTFYQGARSTLQSERVYNVALAYQYDKCTSLVLSASNDAGIISFSPDGAISSTFSVELDSQMRTHALDPGLLPTLVVGMSNNFGSDSATYKGLNALTGAPVSFSAPFRTHTISFYTALRLGNRSFRAAVTPKCLPKGDMPAAS
jgi:hypothetical protein